MKHEAERFIDMRAKKGSSLIEEDNLAVGQKVCIPIILVAPEIVAIKYYDRANV